MSPTTLLALTLLQPPAIGEFSPEKHPVSPDGVRAVCDIPVSQHIRNTGGSDGAGLCVFTSIEHSGDWHGVNHLTGFQRWMTRKPGGGYPEKVDKMLAEYCREKRVPVPAYVQHTDGDEVVLDAAVAAGLMPCITYGGRDDFYRSGIYHMVNLVHLDDKRACIVDNNRPGTFLWMTRAELLTRWRSMQGGWVFVLLASPPPPYSGEPPAQFEEPANFGVEADRVQDPMEPKGPESNNYGIVVAKMRPAAKYSLTGVEVGRDAALDAIRAIGDRINVTAVVKDDQRDGVKADLVKAIAPDDLKRVHLQVYGPSEWEVSQFGVGGLTIRSVAVGRRAKELAHLDGFTPSSAAEAVQKALHAPTPMPPPDGPEPVPVDPPLPDEDACPMPRWACMALAVVAVLLLAGLYRALPRKGV
jgi:hypothetical protein